MNGISVIICCYNSQDKILKTLEHLVAQEGVSFPWEIIIVDNACTDMTADVSRKFLDGKGVIDFVIVQQPTPGLSNARQKGVETAKYSILLFCDDDNWLSPHYLSTVFSDFQQNPDVCIIGGRGIAEFEDAKPSWFDRYQTNFACGELVPCPAGQHTTVVDEVYGAGMAIKRDFFQLLQSISFTSILSDRRGNELISGGDTEYCIVARMMGQKIIYDNRLTFMHYMPEGRVTLAYLRRLHNGFGKSRLYTNAYLYMQSNSEIPGASLRIPFWKDKLLYRKKELRGYYPKIWFMTERDENLPFILNYEALRGEIEEIEKLKEQYIGIYAKILELKNRINQTICPAISR